MNQASFTDGPSLFEHCSVASVQPILSQEPGRKPGISARVALQEEDRELDAIVITTLPCFPFCCHEELLLMSRQQLLDVAKTFNSRLPLTAQICIFNGIADTSIRHHIEMLVGIIPPALETPQSNRSTTREMLGDGQLVQPLGETFAYCVQPFPASPQSMPARARFKSPFASPRPPLESLEEEEEPWQGLGDKQLTMRRRCHSSIGSPAGKCEVMKEGRRDVLPSFAESECFAVSPLQSKGLIDSNEPSYRPTSDHQVQTAVSRRSLSLVPYKKSPQSNPIAMINLSERHASQPRHTI